MVLCVATPLRLLTPMPPTPSVPAPATPLAPCLARIWLLSLAVVVVVAVAGIFWILFLVWVILIATTPRMTVFAPIVVLGVVVWSGDGRWSLVPGVRGWQLRAGTAVGTHGVDSSVIGIVIIVLLRFFVFILWSRSARVRRRGIF